MMVNKVFVLGDIHGRWQTVRDFCAINNIKNEDNTTLILLGDAGINYFLGGGNHRDEDAKKKLCGYPLTYFVIRGNHEERPSICAAKNPDKWHTEEFWGNTVYVENEYPNIKYALDEAAFYYIPGDMRNIDKNITENVIKRYATLVIPGAYSVDKHYRLANGWSWFEKEQLSDEEQLRCLQLVEQFPEVDIVLSHTCPIIFEPTDLFLSCIDQSMVDKRMERFLGRVEYEINYRAWMWGHYHAFRDYPRTDGRKKLMLYDNYAVNLVDYIENEEFEKYETHYCRE